MAPKNSIFFMEVRTDLPGDQRAKLADFMSHFPGFQDRAQFDNALDELLNMLTGEVSPDLQLHVGVQAVDGRRGLDRRRRSWRRRDR